MDAIPDRLLGWVVAGLVATVAGARALAPARAAARARGRGRRGRRAGRRRRALGAPTGGPAPETSTRWTRRSRSSSARRRVPQRPAGPSAHDAALAFLVDQLERAPVLVRTAIAPTSSPDADRPSSWRSRPTTLREIERDARHRARRPPTSTRWSTSCLDTKRAVLEHAVDALGRGEEPGDGARRDRRRCSPERLVLLLAASALANAAIVVSGPRPVRRRGHDPARGAVDRERARHARPGSGTLVEANAVPTSAWAQESLRAGIAVGAAILIAGELRLDHGFWVVLGTLSVLRSNAFATGRTASMAALGTAVGFAISAGAARARRLRRRRPLGHRRRSGSSSPRTRRRWSGSSPGRSCFTIAVVAMFNLIEPQGWQTGLVRLENILIGVVGERGRGARCSGRAARRSGCGRTSPRSTATSATRCPSGIGRIRTRSTTGAPRRAARPRRLRAVPLRDGAEHRRAARPWATLLAEAAQVRFALDGAAAPPRRSCASTSAARRAPRCATSVAERRRRARRRRRRGSSSRTGRAARRVDVAAVSAVDAGPDLRLPRRTTRTTPVPRARSRPGSTPRSCATCWSRSAVLADDALATVPKLPERLTSRGSGVADGRASVEAARGSTSPSRSRSSSWASVRRWPAPGRMTSSPCPTSDLHDRARVGRQDLVAVAVQQQQGSVAERGAVLAARRTGSRA